MDIAKKEKFVSLWKKYFNDSELPVTFYYSDHNPNLPLAKIPEKHRCLLSQLNSVRKGESLCFTSEAITCKGGKRYLGYSKTIRPRFEYFLSHGEEGEVCERYKRNPEQVVQFLERLPELPRKGNHLIFKRWDMLTEEDIPSVVIFFASPDVISALFALAVFDTIEEDAVISPFGAGCTSIVYYPYREEVVGTGRAVIGMFDLSARKCIQKELLSFAIPISKFMTMIDQMEESFLITDTWTSIRRRI